MIAGTAATGDTYFGATLPADPLTSGDPQSGGTQVAYFFGDTETDTLSQTINLTAGVVYQVGFDITPTYTGGFNPGVATISASFGGVQLFSQTTAGLTTPTTETQNNTWTHFGYNFTTNTTGPATFTFTFSADLVPSQDVLIDRVYVAPSLPRSSKPAVPEPATTAMLSSGAIMLGFFCCVRRRSWHNLFA